MTSEFSIGVRCVNWCDDYFKMKHRHYLVKKTNTKTGTTKMVSPIAHVTNEGKMSGKRGNQTNSLGRRAGFPDYILPIPRSDFGGLYIEMKRPGQKMTDPNQIEWRSFLEIHNKYVVCESVEQFGDAVIEYMEW